MASTNKDNKGLMQIDLTKLNFQQLQQLKAEFESVKKYLNLHLHIHIHHNFFEELTSETFFRN